MSKIELDRIALAGEKMREWHQGQTRWDGRPYHIHPAKVAEILYTFGTPNTNTFIAAYLHDVLEDTKVTFDEIAKIFGNGVALLVKELTYPAKCSDKEYWEHTKKLSTQAKLIKTADIIANLTDTGYKSQHFIDKRLRALQIMWQPELVSFL